MATAGFHGENLCIPSKRDDDEDKINWAMSVTGVYDIKGELLSQLSGGQRQRAWIAMSLAQDTDTFTSDGANNFSRYKASD